jgi:hypothetical protein
MTRRNDDFDLDRYRLRPTDVEAPTSMRARQKSNSASGKPAGCDPFVRYPVEVIYRMRAAKYAGTAKLYPLLLHLNWRADHRPFKLPKEDLKRLGISRERKGPVLRELERMGLIRLKGEPRKAPLITVLSLTDGRPDENCQLRPSVLSVETYRFHPICTFSGGYGLSSLFFVIRCS